MQKYLIRLNHPPQEELQDIQDAIAFAKSSFLPLLEYIYNKVQGHDVKLPPVPSDFLCQEYRELYMYANEKLLSTAKGKAKDKDKNRAYQIDKDIL
ncbi:unnamed protein product [Mortierella alpina]